MRPIHLAHSALSEKGCDFERAKSCTYLYRHWNLTKMQVAFRDYAEKRQRKQTQQSVNSSDGPERFSSGVTLVSLHMPGKPRTRRLTLWRPCASIHCTP